MSDWKTDQPTRSANNHIVVREVVFTTYRFKPYSPKSQEYKRGKLGRWQKCESRGDFHDWQNCEPPAGSEWMGADDYASIAKATGVRTASLTEIRHMQERGELHHNPDAPEGE